MKTGSNQESEQSQRYLNENVSPSKYLSTCSFKKKDFLVVSDVSVFFFNVLDVINMMLETPLFGTLE